MLPVKAPANLDKLASESPIAIRFEQVKRANFHYVLNLFSKATLYQVDGLYLATFTSDHYRLLNTILHEIREWKRVTIFANGRPQKSVFSLINWIDCYLTASDCKKPADHCREVIESPFVADGKRLYSSSMTIDIFGNEFQAMKRKAGSWSLPCKFLKPHLNFYKDDEPRAKEKLDALAIKTNCNLCPYFKADEFKVL